ncbi:uncharacterized protein CG31750-like [Drosophila hydei]|uniref:Uncharacterized protein CG31750-like n=1 Tax=Drosophila hydei TaxID=7224 RepID=A0A6J1LXR5_DROHY|nr:uncharacterized protein CG31750-like [Drosophila hydei]
MTARLNRKHREQQSRVYSEEILFHRTVYVLSRILYQICRSCTFGYFNYNPETNKLYICRHENLKKYFTYAVKAMLLFMDYLNYLYVEVKFEAYIFHDCDLVSSGYSFYLEVLNYINVNWHFTKIIVLLHSWKTNESFVSTINKILEIHQNMISSFNKTCFTFDYNILLISSLEFSFTVVQLWNQIMRKKHFLVLKYRIILFEFIYWAYFLYQLILITWHQVLLSSISSCNCRKRNCKRLIKIYKIYFRICEVHGEITQLWLGISGGLFACISLLSADISEELYDVIYQEKSTAEKWKFFLYLKVGNCVAPLLKVFLLGLCTNRIEYLTKFLSQQIYIIELLESGQQNAYTKVLDCQFDCFCLQQHFCPIRNHIWHKGQSINIEFLLLFMWIAFLNAMSNLQYALTEENGINHFY